MNTRKARLIRAGILAARDPELAQYAHLGHRIVRKVARREATKISYRSLEGWAEASRQSIAERHRRNSA